jgi:hypothetical protein
MTDRLNQIKDNFTAIDKRIEKACEKAQRSKNEITLIAVTKTYPAADVDLLKQVGIKDVGENKDQEASEKFKQVKEQFNWHFVGQLQSNKAKSVVTYAELIHSVDRLSLAKAIQSSAQKISKTQQILLQIDLDQNSTDPNRGGVHPNELLALAQEISAYENLKIMGLMCVNPLGQDPEMGFQRLAQIRQEFLERFPQAKILSAGMSDDFDQALLHHATHLRIGSALLGER